MEFVPLLAMTALIISAINLVKFLRAQDWNGVVTTLAVWLMGVAVVGLAAQTDFAGGITMGDYTLDRLNGWSLVFVGLNFGGTATTVTGFRKAIDSTDSASTPKLIP